MRQWVIEFAMYNYPHISWQDGPNTPLVAEAVPKSCAFWSNVTEDKNYKPITYHPENLPTPDFLDKMEKQKKLTPR